MIEKTTMLLIEGEQEDWILNWRKQEDWIITEIYGPIQTLEQNIFKDFFFFWLISIGADHISEMHLILFQYNIANPQNFGTMALLLGWTRSSYWIMIIHHKSIPTSPSSKFQFVYSTLLPFDPICSEVWVAYSNTFVMRYCWCSYQLWKLQV